MHFALDPEMTEADWEAARKLAQILQPARAENRGDPPQKPTTNCHGET